MVTKAQVEAFIAEYGVVPHFEEAKAGKWVCPVCETWVIARNADKPCPTCAEAE